MSRYQIQHGGTIILRDYDNLEEAYRDAFNVKCSRPVEIIEETKPNEWWTVLTIVRKGQEPVAAETWRKRAKDAAEWMEFKSRGGEDDD